ncbi:citryl-CoA lyase [bacterium]|nr:citryl-CoA lyase [bacterium]
MTDLHWDTSITEVTPTKINIRGYPIQDLMGKITFSQTIWLLLMGEMPDETKSKLIDAILTQTIDHGPAPPSCQTVRWVASTGASLNTAVASGIMCMNEFHGGAIEGCFHALQDGIKIQKDDSISFDEAAGKLISDYKAQEKRIPGFGHQLHKIDPRTVRLFEICEELNFDGDNIRMVKALDKAFADSGKPLTLNINGATGAVLGDLGVPPELMSGFFMMSRVPGLIAHSIEEKTRQRPMRKIHPTDWGYDGSEDRDVQ